MKETVIIYFVYLLAYMTLEILQQVSDWKPELIEIEDQAKQVKICLCVMRCQFYCCCN